MGRYGRSGEVSRVAIVDIDIHHGNGTEEIVRCEQSISQSTFPLVGYTCLFRLYMFLFRFYRDCESISCAFDTFVRYSYFCRGVCCFFVCFRRGAIDLTFSILARSERLIEYVYVPDAAFLHIGNDLSPGGGSILALSDAGHAGGPRVP